MNNPKYKDQLKYLDLQLLNIIFLPPWHVTSTSPYRRPSTETACYPGKMTLKPQCQQPRQQGRGTDRRQLKGSSSTAVDRSQQQTWRC